MDTQPPSNENNFSQQDRESGSSLESQMVRALELYAPTIPPGMLEEITAGETTFHIPPSRNTPRAYTLAPIRSGNLGRAIAKELVKNPTTTTRTNGQWQLATLEEGSFLSVVFNNNQGVSKVMSSGAENWLILHKLTMVDDMHPEGILEAIAFYRGAEPHTAV